MKIAVFGTGGVGGYFGGRLAQAGHEVAFIARGAHLAAIREQGLTVESIKGDFSVSPARATDQPQELGAMDWVICGVKAWQVAHAAPEMKPLVGPETAVLPLQNGVEAPDQLAAALGSARVVGGSAWIAAQLAGPGLIRHSGMEPRVVLGELFGGRTPRVEAMRDTLVSAGVRAELSESIRTVMWSKMLFISSISAVGAVTRVPVGELRTCAESRALLVSAMLECVAVARELGVPLPPDAAGKTLAFIDGIPPGTVASMQRDVLEGRPSELEAQSGAIVRLGRKTGIPTPTHAFLYSALMPQERRARGESS